MIQKKICIIGSFAVGKTSLVKNYVHGIFSDKYLTTLGVKIEKKLIKVDQNEIQLMIWDLAGEDEFMSVRMSYLKGSSGVIYVIDGTRKNTMDTALSLKEKVDKEIGVLPSLFLINKDDIVNEWQITETDLDSLENMNLQVMKTSAKNGRNVSDAFIDLAKIIMDKS